MGGFQVDCDVVGIQVVVVIFGIGEVVEEQYLGGGCWWFDFCFEWRRVEVDLLVIVVIELLVC